MNISCLCVYTYIYIYRMYCRQIVLGICPSLQFVRDLVETPKRLSTCVCMSLYRYISYIPAYTYTRTYLQPCLYACLPLCRVVDHGGCVYIDMKLYVIVYKAVYVCRLIRFHSISYPSIYIFVLMLYRCLHRCITSVCIYS